MHVLYMSMAWTVIIKFIKRLHDYTVTVAMHAQKGAYIDVHKAS